MSFLSDSFEYQIFGPKQKKIQCVNSIIGIFDFFLQGNL